MATTLHGEQDNTKAQCSNNAQCIDEDAHVTGGDGVTGRNSLPTQSNGGSAVERDLQTVVRGLDSGSLYRANLAISGIGDNMGGVEGVAGLVRALGICQQNGDFTVFG